MKKKKKKKKNIKKVPKKQVHKKKKKNYKKKNNVKKQVRTIEVIKEEPHKLRTLIVYLLITISFIMFIYSFLNIGAWYIDCISSNKLMNDITDLVNVDGEILKSEEEYKKENNRSDYFEYIKTNFIDVDLNKLKSINEDTAGWILVPNTNVNYPFVKYTDNSYYLNHSFDKKKNSAGWLFMDYRNTLDLNNRNLIIYGHNRKDKSMFGTLKKLLSNNWFNNESNSIIKLKMDSGSSNWQIFSVYIIETTSDYIRTDFTDETDYQEFLNLIKNRSQVSLDTEVTVNDKILTLSTCHGSNKKLVVHAKLINNN